MNEIEVIDKLLSQYDMSMSLPDEVKKEIIRSKKEVLVNILKSAGKYTVSVAVILNIALLLKKAGIGISASKIGFTLHALTALTAATAVAGTGSVIYKSYAEKTSDKITVSAPVEQSEEKVIENNTADPVNRNEILIHKIGIVTFAGNPEIADETSLINKTIMETISGKTGPGTIIASSDNDTTRTQLILRGSVSKINGIYYIRIKLIEGESSRIVAALDRTATTKEEIISASESIAAEICGAIR
jgi:hypothetical protein